MFNELHNIEYCIFLNVHLIDMSTQIHLLSFMSNSRNKKLLHWAMTKSKFIVFSGIVNHLIISDDKINCLKIFKYQCLFLFFVLEVMILRLTHVHCKFLFVINPDRVLTWETFFFLFILYFWKMCRLLLICSIVKAPVLNMANILSVALYYVFCPCVYMYML